MRPQPLSATTGSRARRLRLRDRPSHVAGETDRRSGQRPACGWSPTKERRVLAAMGPSGQGPPLAALSRSLVGDRERALKTAVQAPAIRRRSWKDQLSDDRLRRRAAAVAIAYNADGKRVWEAFAPDGAADPAPRGYALGRRPPMAAICRSRSRGLVALDLGQAAGLAARARRDANHRGRRIASFKDK